MIKLIRPEKPIELTEEKEKELILDFKNTKKAVWRQPYIVERLLNMSHKKCCYCETALETQGRPMHVEHFHCKDDYPDEVVNWDNLLPSCSQCNSNKGTLDTKVYPLVNPTVDDPKNYLYLNHFYIKSKDNALDSKGRETVELLDLNNRDRLLNPRLLIVDMMRYKLNDIHKKAIDLKNRNDGKQYNKNRIVNGIKDVLKMAQPTAEYSAFMGTIILDDEDYFETKDILMEMGFWNNEMQSLHDVADSIKLDTHK